MLVSLRWLRKYGVVSGIELDVGEAKKTRIIRYNNNIVIMDIIHRTVIHTLGYEINTNKRDKYTVNYIL